MEISFWNNIILILLYPNQLPWRTLKNACQRDVPLEKTASLLRDHMLRASCHSNCSVSEEPHVTKKINFSTCWANAITQAYLWIATATSELSFARHMSAMARLLSSASFGSESSPTCK
jgi:hypothetical protein